MLIFPSSNRDEWLESKRFVIGGETVERGTHWDLALTTRNVTVDKFYKVRKLQHPQDLQQGTLNHRYNLQ